MYRWLFVLLWTAKSIFSLTGSLLAPLGEVVPAGHFIVRNYLAYIKSDSNYHEALEVSKFYIGVTPWCDISLFPPLSYRFHEGEQAFRFGDLSAGFDVKLSDWLKFAVREVFPTGKYSELKPRKGWADQSGLGTFTTELEFVFYKLYRISQTVALTMNYSAAYEISSSAKVREFNAYGGGFGADGTIFPGSRYRVNLGYELCFKERWGLALDVLYTHHNRVAFIGTDGINFSGQDAKNSLPSATVFSLAPAIEYNWSKKLGIIGGCWFSVSERKSPNFVSGVVNVQYAY